MPTDLLNLPKLCLSYTEALTLRTQKNFEKMSLTPKKQLIILLTNGTIVMKQSCISLEHEYILLCLE